MAIGMQSYILVILLMFIIFRQCRGLSLTFTGEECVYEEVGFYGNKISGSFIVAEKFRFWKSRHSGIDFSVFDPMGNTVKRIKESTGENFEVSAPRSGIYKFCFHSRNSATETVTFYVHIGHIPKEEELAKHDHLSPLNVRIAMLKEALEFAVTEQRYLRAQDVRHRKTNESTRMRLMAYTLTEYFVLSLASGAQAYLIRGMFRHNNGYTRV